MQQVWDQYFSGVLWAYHNTPHSTIGEKPSYLLFSFECRSPTKAELLPTKPPAVTNINDYREQVVLSLLSTKHLACRKSQCDKAATTSEFKIGDWVLVYFPQEKMGKNRKLSQPWHGPYYTISCNDPDVAVNKIYYPEDQQIHLYQSRVQHCPPSFPAGFCWYTEKTNGYI